VGKGRTENGEDRSSPNTISYKVSAPEGNEINKGDGNRKRVKRAQMPNARKEKENGRINADDEWDSYKF